MVLSSQDGEYEYEYGYGPFRSDLQSKMNQSCALQPNLANNAVLYRATYTHTDR